MDPADAPFDLTHRFAEELPELCTPWQGDEVPAPEVIVVDDALAAELGIDPADLRTRRAAEVLVGMTTIEGTRPVAQGYAGHQFGGYSPRLGDGRALLLGELRSIDGRELDLHLKGSGRTPFSRGGDGKATIGSMLREHLMASAMHALGIPTTRSLAVSTTGEAVRREDGPQPGAVLARVASSHLRVGTFSYAAALGEAGLVERLVDEAIARHHPEAATALDLFESVSRVQAGLVARWMGVGFVHGVMNTDNTTISGETIDYGPCAFMDAFDPATVFSSIDHAGRYAYGNQPHIVQWNLARLAEALLPLIDADQDTAVALATEVLHRFPDQYTAAWHAEMRAKLGLVTEQPDDASLFDDLLAAMHEAGADHTATFRALSSDDLPDLGPWVDRYRTRLATEGRDSATVAEEMDRTNPIYVPRNHLVEEALAAATAGDLEPFGRLLDATTHPFEERSGLERYASPAPADFSDGYQTFCGT